MAAGSVVVPWYRAFPSLLRVLLSEFAPSCGFRLDLRARAHDFQTPVSESVISGRFVTVFGCGMGEKLICWG